MVVKGKLTDEHEVEENQNQKKKKEVGERKRRLLKGEREEVLGERIQQ